MVVVAIAALQCAYARFVRWALADWGPNLPADFFQGAPRGADEAYCLREREKRIAELTVGSLLVANVALAGWAAMRLWGSTWKR